LGNLFFTLLFKQKKISSRNNQDGIKVPIAIGKRFPICPICIGSGLLFF